jgi:hypothetical protein
MIKRFVSRFDAARDSLRAGLLEKPPSDYDDLFRRLMAAVSEGSGGDYGLEPDPERITRIDHGDYQGTILYTVGACGYQPSNYWATFVGYGSCSGCDTFEAIRGYGSGECTDKQAGEYLTLMLHMLQGMKAIGHKEEESDDGSNG